jgi:hypothetical protein
MSYTLRIACAANFGEADVDEHVGAGVLQRQDLASRPSASVTSYDASATSIDLYLLTQALPSRRVR